MFVAWPCPIVYTIFDLYFNTEQDRIDLMESRGGGSLVVWMFLFTFMASCGMYRIDAVNRRSFLAKLELRRSLDVAEVWMMVVVVMSLYRLARMMYRRWWKVK